MYPRRHRAILFSAFCCLLTSCTTVAATKKGAVGFNRVFADARNEVLLLNILRAEYGEPQQFSTIATVTGGMRPDMKVTGGLDNLILGAANIFNPAGEFGFRNPSITIAPLETKEFRQGMMKAVDIAFVDELLREGWDSRTVFHLAVAGIKCGDQTYLAGNGPNHATKFAESAKWKGVKDAKTKAPSKPDLKPARSVAVSAAEAAKMVREGAGDSLELKIIPSETGDGPNTVRVQFGEPVPKVILLGPGSQICGPAATEPTEFDPKSLMLRSPGAMIQYLGALIRPKEGDSPVSYVGGNEFFKVHQVQKLIPPSALVGTRFRHNLYYVEHDRGSPQTLALLAEIIGFQTTDASLNAGKPTLTVPQE